VLLREVNRFHCARRAFARVVLWAVGESLPPFFIVGAA